MVVLAPEVPMHLVLQHIRNSSHRRRDAIFQWTQIYMMGPNLQKSSRGVTQIA